MKEVTTHFAETHLSRLLKEVQDGETVIILQGRVPVGQLTGILPKGFRRPKVGMVSSAPVILSEDAFAPMSDREIEELGRRTPRLPQGSF